MPEEANYKEAALYLERRLFEHRKRIICVGSRDEIMEWTEDHFRAWRQEETALKLAILACEVLAKKAYQVGAKSPIAL